ncbi:capsid cement protein [Rhodococcus sp. NPDC056960]|uniref:capsid cement protein n=1 Tax=Rhodococcus sp. NPDC056960 TaxID=3345982 RepID=UPI00362893A7
MANENIGVYEPGRDLTGRASAAVTGKRFLKISGNRSSGNIAVAHADAAGRVCGVSKYDAASGDIVGVARGNSRVTFVTASANIAAFAEVEVAANGQAVTKSSGVAVGYAVTAATSGGDAEISLY